MKPNIAWCGNDNWQIERVYAQGRREQIAELGTCLPTLLNKNNFDSLRSYWEGVEVLFSTWGMDEELALRICELPKVRVVFYAAGTVQPFARPLLDRNILVVSAWAANAVPVAQFTFAQILLSLKGYFRNIRESYLPDNRGKPITNSSPGIFENSVALLGYGMVAREVAKLLQSQNIQVLAYAPFISDAEAQKEKIERVALIEAFSRADLVSNHLADLPATRGLLNQELFASMRIGTTFINTGRGVTVNEEDLRSVLKSRLDLTALLDVVHPEPPTKNSPWYECENALISSHIAGSLGKEVVRMADYMIAEFKSWLAGKPLKYAVTIEMLETMA